MSLTFPSPAGECAPSVTAETVEVNLPAAGPNGSRSIAQRNLFVPPFRRVPDDLYCVVRSGTARRERGRLVVHPHGRVSTNCYFGRFPASYWQRWTSVEDVQVDVVAAGTGWVSVHACDRTGSPRLIDAAEITGSGPDGERRVVVPVRIDRFVDGGALWVEFHAGDAGLEVRQLQWTVGAPPRLRKTAVVMCTFNRADDCLRTLDVLAADLDALCLVDAVHVVDQGEQTVESRPEFGRVRSCLGGKLHYRRQANLGGAGGFTRGLYEATEATAGEPVNVLFIDDDILLEPDVVLRMITFANHAVEPTIVGGQMLQLLHPHRLHVGAETARFTTIEPGLAVPGALDRVDLTREQQNLRVDADYNAWWCCLIPSEVVADVGYPLPMFFQWDDVEYGYRTRGRGPPTVTLPGAGVWHADFDWKDEDDPARYFTLRNALIIDALHGQFRPRAAPGSSAGGCWSAWCPCATRRPPR